MKLIKDKKFLQNVAQYIDLANTVSGGVSQPQVKLDKQKGKAVLRVTLPGIEPEQCQVLVDRNQLTVMVLQQTEQETTMQMPLFSQTFLLPPYADMHALKAEHHGRELRVQIPYLPQGPRFLDIEGAGF